MTLRVVVDTDIFFEALERIARSAPGHPYVDVLDALINGEFTPIWSTATLQELKHMLCKGKKAREVGISQQDAQDVIDLVLGYGEQVAYKRTIFTVGPDRDDDMFVEAAIEARVTYLVARDHHFSDPGVIALVESHGCKIVRAGKFVQLLREAISTRPSRPK